VETARLKRYLAKSPALKGGGHREGGEAEQWKLFRKQEAAAYLEGYAECQAYD